MTTAFIRITLTPEPAALLAALQEDVRAAIKAGLVNLIGQIEARGAREAPRKTGTLAGSITSYLAGDGLSGIIAATAPYASYVHEGTGLYGPYGQEIVTKRTTKKRTVCEVHRKGRKPNPFFFRAIGAIDPQAVFDQGVQAYLTRRNV